MEKLFLSFASIGVTEDLPSWERAKVIVLNKIVIISMWLSLVVLTATISFQLWIPVVSTAVVCFFVLVPVFILHYYHRYDLARFLFSNGLLLVLIGLGIMNARAGKSFPSEIVIVGVSTATAVLFDGYKRTIYFLLYALAAFIVFVFRESLINGVTVYTIVSFLNHSIAFVNIYFFSRYYQREINQHIVETESLLKELKKREEQILSESIIQEALIDNTPVLLSLVDVEGYYVTVNRAYEEACKIPKNKLIGKHFSEVLPQEFFDFHLPKFQKAIEGNEVEFEEDFRELTGEEKCMMGKYFPVYSHDTKEVKYISVFKIDISKQKSAEKALQKINKTKDKLFSIIAHDLVGPIHNLDDILYLNDINQISEADLAKYNANVRQRLGVIKHMIFNLLHWAKRQFKGEEDSKEVVSIDGIVGETIELYKDSILKKGVKIQVKIPDDLRCAMDKNHIEVVIRNLISNAIKYSHEQGEINVELIRDGQYKLLKIKDQGVGISQDKLDNIRTQDNFYSKKGTQGEEGIGLGLHLCFDLAKWNGWELYVESEFGKGSEFTLKIPFE